MFFTKLKQQYCCAAQVEQLTGEINALRERIRDAAEEGFGLLDSSTETGIVLPRCLVDSVCLTTSSLRDAPARMDRATALDQAVSRILHQKHFRRPVSEGFALVSERSDLERLEQKLDGRWGSYGLFERCAKVPSTNTVLQRQRIRRFL